jgi:hypothetical protein
LRQKHTRYSEGQWFTVPLRKGSYALGIIVRGSYKTKGGLGYFFGPQYAEIPGDKQTWEKHPEDAIICIPKYRLEHFPGFFISS